MKLIDVLGIEFDNIDIAEAVELSLRAMYGRDSGIVLALDSQQLMLSRRSRRIRRIINRAMLVLPADKGIFAAALVLGLPLVHKMSAQDYIAALCARMSEGALSAAVLTRDGYAARRAAEDMQRRFPGVELVCSEDIRKLDGEDICGLINAASPDLLIMYMDYEAQMSLIHDLADRLETGIILGLGNAPGAYSARRGGDGFFRRLFKEPGRVLKDVIIVLAALKKRIFG